MAAYRLAFWNRADILDRPPKDWENTQGLVRTQVTEVGLIIGVDAAHQF